MENDYVRIGTSFYKLVNKPSLTGKIKEVIIPWSRQAILDDHNKETISEMKKYEGFIVHPSHDNYKKEHHHFYNQYQPLNHDLKVEYKEGSISNTLEFLNHIFGDQIQISLDFLTIMWKMPTQILPILCLVSEERNTGKTTFLNWLKLIFQNNMTFNKNEDFRSRFNSDWSEKIIIAIDEVLLDKREDSERIKNLSTSQDFKTEAKGKDKVESPFFGKFILCSNNETNFINIDDKEIRFWVRKINTLNYVDPNLAAKLEDEIPQFVALINSRKILSPKKSRMWFDKKQLHTPALDKLFKGNKLNLEKELLFIIEELILDYELNEIKLTLGDLRCKAKESFYKVTFEQIKDIVEKKWKLESSNSSYYKYFKSIDPQTGNWMISSTNVSGRYFIFQKEFIQNQLNC